MLNSADRDFRSSVEPDHFPQGTTADLANTVLLVLLAEIEAFAEIPQALLDVPVAYAKQMMHMGVPYRPRVWFGGALSPRLRKMCSRGVDRLQRDGLVERITESKRDRVTHLRLTPEGLKRALALAEPDADRAAVVAGLRRTNWGGTLGRRAAV